MSKLGSILKYKVLRPFFESVGCGFLSSVALEHIDLQLISLMNFQRGGFFIEAGANDGVLQSNTYYLEKVLGWHGLLVEPLAEKAEKCKKNRRNSAVVNAALVRHGYDGETVEFENAGLMSTVNDGTIDRDTVEQHVAVGRELQQMHKSPPRKVPAVSLSRLLREQDVRMIDFFSLDVEGYEVEVLKGIDFDEVTFRRVFIETRQDNEATIDRYLREAGLEITHEWKNPSYSNKLYVNLSEIANKTAK